MQLIKIYIDFGTGYELTNPSYSGSLTNENEINPFIFRKKVNIESIFFGSDYVKILAKINTGSIKLPFKVELYNTDTQLYAEFATGEVMIREKLDYDKKTITLSNFVVVDAYTELLKLSETEWDVSLLWITGSQVLTSVQLFRLDNIVIEVTYDFTLTDYKNKINPDGSIVLPTQTDYRWTNWTFDYEEEVTPGDPFTKRKFYFHAFESPFEASPLLVQKIAWLGSFKYVGATLTTISLEMLKDKSAITIVEMMEFLLLRMNLSNTVENNSLLSPFYLADISRLSINTYSNVSQSIFFSISQAFELLSDLMQIHWYIDANEITFKHISELSYSVNLFNLATYYQKNLNAGANMIEFYDNESPITETFITQNAKTYGFADLTIIYPTAITENKVNVNSAITCDLQNVWNNILTLNQGVLLLGCDYVDFETLSLTSTNVTPNGTYIYNNKASWNYIFDTFLNNGRPFDSGEVNFTESTESLNALISQPLASHTFTTFMNAFIFDAITNNHITTDIGNGKVKTIELDILSGSINWKIEYYTL